MVYYESINQDPRFIQFFLYQVSMKKARKMPLMRKILFHLPLTFLASSKEVCKHSFRFKLHRFRLEYNNNFNNDNIFENEKQPLFL